MPSYNNKENKRACNEKILKITYGPFAPAVFFFNLWKYGKEMSKVLLKTTRFVERKTWFTKIDNYYPDIHKTMFSFVEVQLALLKRLPNNVQNDCGVWMWN